MPGVNYSFIATISLITWSYVFIRAQSVPINTAIPEAAFVAVICTILFLSSRLIRRINAVLA